MNSRAEYLVRKINELDIPHRKGWKPSDRGSLPTLESLRGEVDELDEALDDLRAFAAPPAPWSAAERYLRDHAREEVADVFVCTLQIAFQLGMSFEALDAEAVRKLRLRFIGADAIPIPERTRDEADRDQAQGMREMRCGDDAPSGLPEIQGAQADEASETRE